LKLESTIQRDMTVVEVEAVASILFTWWFREFVNPDENLAGENVVAHEGEENSAEILNRHLD
jgi:hypothetical protein